MKLLFLFAFTAVVSLSFAQTKNESVDFTINSEVFNDQRTISVFVPSSYYSRDTTKNYPVAYLFDSQFSPYFSMVCSIISYYEQTSEGISMIVVGIHSKNRWGEFVPICEEKDLENIKGADRLTLFLKKEVIPLIDSTYRTNTFKIGIGHSLGGTFVINEIIKANSLFNGVIAASPNLTICNEKIVHKGEKFFMNKLKNQRFIYSSCGTVGDMENNFRKSLLHFDSAFSSNGINSIYWNCEILENRNHMTTFVPTFNNGYLALSSKLMLLDVQLIQMSEDSMHSISENLLAFYDELSSFTKEEQKLSVDQIMKYEKTLSYYKKYNACVELCRYASELLESEDIPKSKKKKVTKLISHRQIRAEFNAVAYKAYKFAQVEDYTNASRLYIEAFDMGLIRATHFVRMDAVPVLAQAGEIEEAFKQLGLLANKFKLRGNERFINDILCMPLHKDKRWKKLMDKLEKNKKSINSK